MRNCLAQLVVVDENELQSLSECVCGQKITGYFSVFKWKAEPEFKITLVFWKKKRDHQQEEIAKGKY